MEPGFIPWLLAGLTAGWFGWMAHRAGRQRTLWAVGGAAFALVTSTIVFGLGQAVSIPCSDRERAIGRLEWAVAAVALIALLGWLLTLSLHRHHLVVWRKIRPGPGPTEASSGDAKSGSARVRK